MTRIRQIFGFIHPAWGKKKRLFFGLLFLSLLSIAGTTYGLLRISAGVMKKYNPYFALLIQWGLVIFFLITLSSILLLGINLLIEIKLPFNEQIRKITIYFFFPLTIFLAKILCIPKEQIQESFLEVNNKLIQAKKYSIVPQKILLLLPHCLQNSQCSIKLTLQGDNCQRCGSCGINDLWEIVNRYKIRLAIATGGEAARKFIVDVKPEAVVAVACTKEMILGLQDTYPLSVLSIVNQWPNGPCSDTLVDLAKVEDGIKFFLGDNKAKKSPNALS